MSKSVALIVPCFNEENRLDTTRWEKIFLDNLNVDWYFVNDGSNDATDEILEKIASKNFQSVHLISSEKNLGKGNAIRLGLLCALDKNPYNIVGYLDSDLSYSVMDINRIILQMINTDDLECLICSRVNLSGRLINRKRNRHLLGRIIAGLIGIYWKDAPYDTQAGFKLFKSNDQLLSLLNQPFQTRWFFDIELLIRLKNRRNATFTIWEEPANYWEDVSGSKLNYRQFSIVLKELKMILTILKKTVS